MPNIPTSPIVANIVYKIVPFGKIFADEFCIPSSVMCSVQLFTNFLEEVISDIFNHGIVPLVQ